MALFGNLTQFFQNLPRFCPGRVFFVFFIPFLGIPALVLLLVEDEQVDDEEEGERDEGVVVEVRPQKGNAANLLGFLE